MLTNTTRESAFVHLQARFPEIAFFLSVTPLEERKIAHERLEQELSLSGIDVLYLYGLSLEAYLQLKEWLHAERQRALIILEEDLATISAFLNCENATALLSDPQVHLKWFEKMDHLEELVHQFPTDRLEVVALPKQRPQKVKRIRLQLLRSSSAFHALLAESLYAHKLFKNLYPNFKRLNTSFFANAMKGVFEGVHAIICGAGPSLAKAAPLLKQLQERALIIAGGSAVAALGHLGVAPHLTMALDPNHEEFLRFKPVHAFETPFLWAGRLFSDVFSTCNGPFGYVRSDTGGLVENWMEEKLGIEAEVIGPDLGKEAFSVTTLAIALATFLGCNPIILVGVDLAFTNLQSYADGVVENKEMNLAQLKKNLRSTDQLLRRRDKQGKSVYTLVKWVMEAESIGAYAENHPERLFLNATEGGISCPHVSNVPLEQIAENYCTKERDIAGLVHSIIQKNPLQVEQVEEPLQELLTSLNRSRTLCEELLQEIKRVKEDIALPLETGKMALLKSDLEQEIAFDCFLHAQSRALDFLFHRTHPLTEENHRIQFLLREQVRYEQCCSALVEMISFVEA